MGRGSTARHNSFQWIKKEGGKPARCWTAVNKTSGYRVTELREQAKECVNCIQVPQMMREGDEPLTLVNVYDQRPRGGGERLARQAEWGSIMRVARVVIAGDMNAHCERWSPRTKKRGNALFWEELVEEYELVIWNSEEGTRAGPTTEKTSIIDLTLSSPSVLLNWCLL